MSKRLLTVFLAATMLLSTAACLFAAFLTCADVFAGLDDIWESSLAAASLRGDIGISDEAAASHGGARYIVGFRSETPRAEIAALLEKTEYVPLSHTSSGVFAVSCGDEDVLERIFGLCEYYEADFPREVFRTTNDPIPMPVMEDISVPAVRDITSGGKGVTVAVIDTGISREHEDLAGADILAGYDAPRRTAGVYSDSSGHGTEVTGVIAATADNGLGVAGIAWNATILPIKVSDSEGSIFSSDLIAAIHFAADSGAKIINISVGGYSYSAAEQEAVDYAVSKGCIIVAAAGNGGNRSFAGQKSYPASYSGVISVGSCNADGERSDFSQYNEAVDIVAPGENLPVLILRDGGSAYGFDSGTSLSCAVVSSVAALMAGDIGEYRFCADEFLAVIRDVCGSVHNDNTGYGVVDALAFVLASRRPIVTGVCNGESYSRKVKVGFNRGSASLDGYPVSDGFTVVTNGMHRLTVTDGENETSISFLLRYTPLSYTYSENGGYSSFVFTRGTGELDGFPYISGTPITASGRHYFRLEDDGEVLTETVDIGFLFPTVLGVEEGGKYDRPIEIRIIGSGGAELDGEPIYGEAAVYENGEHELYIHNSSGDGKRIKFSMNIPGAAEGRCDLESARAALDREYGYTVLYCDSLVGIRVYGKDEPLAFDRFIPTGTVLRHAFDGDDIAFILRDGVAVYGRASLASGEDEQKLLYRGKKDSKYAYVGGVAYEISRDAVTAIYGDGTSETVASLIGAEISDAICLGGSIYIFTYTEQGAECTVFDTESRALSPAVTLSGAAGGDIVVSEEYIAVGSAIYSAESGRRLLSFCSDRALAIEGGLLFTERRVIDIASGDELGSFPFEVTAFLHDGGFTLYGLGGEYFSAEGGEGMAQYGAAARIHAVISNPESTDIYRTRAELDRWSEVACVYASAGRLYLAVKDSPRLYYADIPALENSGSLPLRAQASALVGGGGKIAAVLSGISEVYIASEDRLASGSSFAIPGGCSSAAFFGERLAIAAGGRLYMLDTESGALEDCGVSADEVASASGRLYVLHSGVLYAYGAGMELIASVPAAGEQLCAADAVTVGRNVYDPATLEKISVSENKIIASAGSCAVTKSGLLSLSDAAHAGRHFTPDATAAAVNENGAAVVIGSCINVIYSPLGKPVLGGADIMSPAQGGVYRDGVTLEYSGAVGYIDGVPAASGTFVSDVGRHTFTAVLPGGRNTEITFTVVARMTGIEFVVAERHMNIGETIQLSLTYLPFGADSVPVAYYCGDDGISVSESGVVEAIRTGTYTVRAEAATPDGESFSAECTVIVRDDMISFRRESGITVDRDSGFIIGVPAGITHERLSSFLAVNRATELRGADMLYKDGIVATGDRLVLYDGEGGLSDSLIIVVTGDVSGDGYITAYDEYVMEEILTGREYAKCFLRAADITGNGILSDTDRYALSDMLLTADGNVLGVPERNLFGYVLADTVSAPHKGDVIDAVVCLVGTRHALGISGAVTVSGAEIIGFYGTGWEVDCRYSGGRAVFYAHAEDGSSCDRLFKTVINLRLRVTKEAGGTVNIVSEGFNTDFADGARVVSFTERTVGVAAREEGEFSFDIKNARVFTFYPRILEYTVDIPYNSAVADVAWVCPAGGSVEVTGAVVPDSGKSVMSVRFTDKDGSTTEYTVNVRRERAPVFRRDCLLSELYAEGFRLSPAFDPETTSYTLTVPAGTERVNIYCTALSADDTVVIGDTALYGEKTDIRITVISPEGDTRVYTVSVFRESAAEESSGAAEDPVRGIHAAVAAVVALLAAAAAAVIIIVYRRKKQSNTGNEE